MQKVITSELKPTNGRKSFGGKAKLMYNPENRGHYLRSYDTTMAGYVKGKVHRYSDFQSATTSTHLRSFFDACGVDMSIKDFYALKCEECPALAI